MQDKQDTVRFRFDVDNRMVREDAASLIYSVAARRPPPGPATSKGAQLRMHAQKTGGRERDNQRILSAALRCVQTEMRRERMPATVHIDAEGNVRSRIKQALADEVQISPARRQRNHAAVLLRGFQVRKKLLDGALTTKEVAALLGGSRQMPLDRLKANRLVAARDSGDWRFPVWQFDSMGPDGVVEGLPAVLATMPSSGLQRIAWLGAPHPVLGATPIDALRSGRFERVLREAQAVGVS